DGVEGLVHISELAPHHVESPREVVHPGDEIRVKILEIDSERRRLSLSAKRVEDQILPVSRPGDAASEAQTEATPGPPATQAPEDAAANAEHPEAEGEEAPQPSTTRQPAAADQAPAASETPNRPSPQPAAVEPAPTEDSAAEASPGAETSETAAER